MLRNFCEEHDHSITVNVNMEMFAEDSGEKVTNAVVQELCIIQPEMRSLNLRGCRDITDVSLWTIAKHCPYLREIVFAGCNQLTSTGLRSLTLRCSDLEVLDFSDCHLLDDMGLTTISCGCFKLEKLILRNCIGITDTGVGKVPSFHLLLLSPFK